jgi:hypothetical protein
MFLVLKHPKICISISSVFQKLLLEKRHVFISNQNKPFAHRSNMTVSTRDRLHNSSFYYQSNTPTITLTLHCSSTMVGRHEKQRDSNTTSTSSSALASAVSADWDIAPPLQNARVDTQYAGIIEEQKQHIKQLQEELAQFNHVQYRSLPANASRGKNVLRTSKKMSMTPTDHINPQEVACYIREAIWPGNKMLPRSWSKWRDDKRSLCQMILKKVALSLGVMESHPGRQ